LHVFDSAPDGEDLRDAFIPAYGDGISCPETGCPGRFGRVDALDLVYVRGVDGRGEEADVHAVAVGWGDGVAVEFEDGGGFAVGLEDERFGLLVAVEGDAPGLLTT
jgi:hypothetical protein